MSPRARTGKTRKRSSKTRKSAERRQTAEIEKERALWQRVEEIDMLEMDDLMQLKSMMELKLKEIEERQLTLSTTQKAKGMSVPKEDVKRSKSTSPKMNGAASDNKGKRRNESVDEDEPRTKWKLGRASSEKKLSRRYSNDETERKGQNKGTLKRRRRKTKSMKRKVSADERTKRQYFND